MPEEELAALYLGAACLVYPSRWEGFGLPPLEAMSLGTPVIASVYSSLPEVLGQAAYYVEPLCAGAIDQAARRLLHSPALTAELVTRGRVQAARFSWQETARATAAVYRLAAGTGSSYEKPDIPFTQDH